MQPRGRSAVHGRKEGNGKKEEKDDKKRKEEMRSGKREWIHNSTVYLYVCLFVVHPSACGLPGLCLPLASLSKKLRERGRRYACPLPQRCEGGKGRRKWRNEGAWSPVLHSGSNAHERA
mmetsp:Transcript_26310/g.51703  ORF Transcript_26310/g.51703 Transcript_26310/m.51703 type:complete len:119 (-) Transcript_26310:286-642(-)